MIAEVLFFYLQQDPSVRWVQQHDWVWGCWVICIYFI